VGISRDYPLKTQTSKQPIGEIPEYEIIPSHPLKYPRSIQNLKVGQQRAWPTSTHIPQRGEPGEKISILHLYYTMLFWRMNT
jgi:hypothetical protein